MPSTPKINFNFINNNVEVSTPQKGVSTVLARTTKGPVLDPSVLVTSITQFKREFGEELVPNGSKSNIEAALERGSKLRIIRVVGPGSTNGLVNTEGKPCFTIEVDGKKVGVKLTTRRAGEAIGTDKTFSVKFAVVNNTLNYEVVNAGGQQITSGPVFTYKTQDAHNNTSVDYLALASWVQNNPYFKVAMVNLDSSGEETTPVSIESFLNKLAKIDGTSTAIKVEIKAATAAGTIGEVETSQPTSAQWITALEYIKDYTDSYNVILSHLDQHLGNSEAIKVYIALRTILDEINEFRGFIEIPWYDTNGVVRTLDSIVQLAQQLQTAIGHSKWISYFAGGLKYSNSFGLQQNSDVLGTVLGLADTSATGYGYNYSFAGVNRGVVLHAGGPVVPNFGSPARFKDLETLANNYVNIFVVKDTPSFGKRTLLWHNFTSQVKNDSFRFIGNTGLILNIKKTLRTILESYIEEPNIWSTWSDIYAVVKPIISNWVDNNAITDPKWNGDQDASSWSGLKVNTEEEVRQGKYHVVFTFKDVVSMQQVTVDVVLEKASKSITMDVNNSTSN